MTTIQVRVKEKTKTKAKKILDDLGLDMSTAVNMYLEQIIHERALPFRPRLMANDLISTQEAEIRKQTKKVEEDKDSVDSISIEEFIKILKDNSTD